MADQEIRVTITASDEGLSSAMDQATEAIGRLPSAAQSAGEAASEFSDSLSRVGEIAAGLVGGLGIERILEGVKEQFREATTGTYEWAEGLENLSYSTGASVTSLQKLQDAFAIAGVSADRIGMFTTQLVRRLGEVESSASGGSKAFRSAMEVIGATRSDFTDINGLLLKLSDYMNKVGVNSLQAREVLAEFGSRQSASFAPALANLRAYEEESSKLGLILSTEEVEGAAHAEIAINRLGLTWATFLRTAGTGTSTLAEMLATDMTAAIFRVQADIELMEVSWEALTSYFQGTAGTISDALKIAFAPIRETIEALPALKTFLEGFTGIGLTPKPPPPASVGPAFSGTASVDKVTAINEQLQARLAELAKPITTPSAEGGGLGGPGLPQIENAQKVATQKYEILRAGLALEEAEYKTDADKKLAAVNEFVAKVRAIQNLPAKDMTEALAIQAREYDSFYAEKQRLALTDLANQESIAKAVGTLQVTQAKGAFDEATAAIRNRLAAGQETKLQELADQRDLMNQTLALDLNLEAQRFANQKAALDQQLDVLRASKAATQEELNKAYTAEEVALAEHLNRMAALQNNWAVAAGNNAVQATAESTKEMTTLWTSALEPISRAFDQSFTGIIQGTQTVSQAFKKMGEDIALSMARSAIQDFLLGGKQGTLGGAVFGVQGQTGGANIASLLTQAFAASGMNQVSTLLTQHGSLLSSMVTHGASLVAQGAEQLVQLVVIAAQAVVKAVPGIGWLLEGGGVMSAAGGTVVGGSASFAILHPREMTLPRNISEHIMRTAANPDLGQGGGGHTVNLHVHANDTKGFDELLKSRSGMLERMIKNALR